MAAIFPVLNLLKGTRAHPKTDDNMAWSTIEVSFKYIAIYGAILCPQSS